MGNQNRRRPLGSPNATVLQHSLPCTGNWIPVTTIRHRFLCRSRTIAVDNDHVAGARFRVRTAHRRLHIRPFWKCSAHGHRDGSLSLYNQYHDDEIMKQARREHDQFRSHNGLSCNDIGRGGGIVRESAWEASSMRATATHLSFASHPVYTLGVPLSLEELCTTRTVGRGAKWTLLQ